MSDFTITDEMLTGLVNPSARDLDEAHYLVVFSRSRADEEDYVLNPHDHAQAIKQFIDELQEAGYDQGGMAGNFQVIARRHRHVWHTTDEAYDVLNGPVTITVVSADGRDLTQELASHSDVDGNLRANDQAPPGSRGPIGRLSDLPRDVALVCLAQIIDQGREWGTTDELAELLYKQAELLVRDGGQMILPDGWIVTIKVADTKQ